LRLRNELTGELVKGRCRSTNLCDYCAKLAAVENSEMLALDAMDGNAPQVWLVLTTSIATLDMSVFYRAHEKLMKAIQRRFPGCEWARLLEFTTGYGPRSGGRRRPHWNCLLKGVPATAVDVVLGLVEKVWCPRVGGAIAAQHVGSIAEAGGLLRYIALHFQKESQAPPRGFTGHRFTKSRGYFGTTSTATARARAREALQHKRELWKAINAGADPHDAELQAHEAMKLATASAWVLATDRGARLSSTCHDPRRMLLAALRRRWQDVPEWRAELRQLLRSIEWDQ